MKKNKQKLVEIEEMNKEEAEKITKEIAELMKENIKNFWEISKRLRKIRKGKGYKHFGYKTYEEYCQAIHDIVSRTARAYIQVLEYMEKWHAHATFERIEPQKVLLLSRLDSEEYEEKRKELDKKVFDEDISWRELEEELKKIKGKGEDWLRIIDVWNFKENTGEGISNLPPEIIKNLLYYYTKEGDLILDPFAGSGQTYKIAKEMNRECICSDINPSKDFIIEWDVEKGFKDFPEDLRDTSFIFLDPPYWKKVEYEGGWSNLSLEEFYARFEVFVSDCDKILKKGGKIALIIMPLRDKSDGKYIDLGFECYNALKKRFKIIQRLCVPLQKNWALDSKRKEVEEKKEIYTASLRDLMIFKKC